LESSTSLGLLGVPSFGIIVEGQYDTAVFGQLVCRICPGADIARAIEAGGSIMSKFPNYLKALQYVTATGPVDRALVIRDSNGKDPRQVEAAMQARIDGRHYSFPHGIVFHAVRQEMETWLLADVAAISAAADGREVKPAPGALEDLADAKGVLRERLSGVDIPYTAAAAARIAETLNLDVLRRRCPCFVLFEERVTAGLC
jgi:hypothetical protein